MMKLRNILACVLIGLPLLAIGQSRSLPILEINPDARATAMGGNQYGEASTMLIYANPTTLLYENMNWEVSAATQIYPKADEDIGRLMFYGVSAGKRFGNHGVHVGFRYLGGYDIPADEGKEHLEPMLSCYRFAAYQASWDFRHQCAQQPERCLRFREWCYGCRACRYHEIVGRGQDQSLFRIVRYPFEEITYKSPAVAKACMRKHCDPCIAR